MYNLGSVTLRLEAVPGGIMLVATQDGTGIEQPLWGWPSLKDWDMLGKVMPAMIRDYEEQHPVFPWHKEVK